MPEAAVAGGPVHGLRVVDTATQAAGPVVATAFAEFGADARVAVANAVFSPTEEEITEAEEAIKTYRASEADGVGAIGRDGKLVDAAHMRLATNTLYEASLAKDGPPSK